jgi:hypothetical protein
VRPVFDERGLIIAMLVAVEGRPLQGFWTIPARSGHWAVLAEGRDPDVPGGPRIEIRFNEGWEAFFTYLGPRTIVADDWSHTRAAVLRALLQRDSGRRDAESLGERLGARPQIDLQEIAAALAARGYLGPGPHGLAELAESAGAPLPPEHLAAWRRGALNPFVRLAAGSAAWQGLLRPALLAFGTESPRDELLTLVEAPEEPAVSSGPRQSRAAADEDIWVAYARRRSAATAAKVAANQPDWRHYIVAADHQGPIGGLVLWFPRSEHEAVRALPFSDLLMEPETLTLRSGETRHSIVLRPQGPKAVALTLRLDTRSARHLCDVLATPLQMGEVLHPPEAVRLESELDGLHRSPRSLNVEAELETGEDDLPGPALRLMTFLPKPDASEGLELLFPIADATPDRLRARLERLLVP